MEVHRFMSDTYNPHAKILYRPIEAALRWCNLFHFEAQIMQATWSYPDELSALLPQWPCLYIATEKSMMPYETKSYRMAVLVFQPLWEVMSSQLS
jgi:hypothetical protein